MFRTIPNFELYEMDSNKTIRHKVTKKVKSPHRGGDNVRLYTTEGKELTRKIDKLFNGTYPELVPGVVVEPYFSYRVLDTGEVYSMHEAKILRPSKTRDGYLQVSLQVGSTGKYKSELVHRLVAKAYLQIEERKGDVNHINGDKADNRVANLEWCTKSENLEHAVKTGLYDTKIRGCTLTKDGVTLEFKSIEDAAEYLGVVPSAVRGPMVKNWKGIKPSRGKVGKYVCKGYIPEYIERPTDYTINPKQPI